MTTRTSATTTTTRNNTKNTHSNKVKPARDEIKERENTKMRDKRTFFQHVWHDTETKCGAHVSFWRPTIQQHTHSERGTHTYAYSARLCSHTDSNMWLDSLIAALSTHSHSLTRALSSYIFVSVCEWLSRSVTLSHTPLSLSKCVVFVCVLFVQSPLRCLLSLSLSLGRITLIKVYLRDYTK